jgi:tetratricopeptide (TPR) repeat protein
MLGKRLASLLLAVTASCLSIQLCCDWQGAEAKVRSQGKNTVSPAQANFEVGMVKYQNKDLDGAIDAFLQSIYFSRNYYDPNAYYWLGVCYMEKKEDAKAIDAFNKHCAQSVKLTPEAHVHLGNIYLRNDRLNEADQEGKLALTHYSGPASKAHNLLGKVAQKKGALDVAQEEFLQALGDQPWSYTEAWMNYAENMMKQKAWGSALDQFDFMLHNKIILKGLDYPKVFLDIGLCRLAKGDHQGAFDNWHESLNYNPQYADTHLQLGMLLDSEQHFASAIKEYEQYVRFTSDPEGVDKIKQRIHALEQKTMPNEVEPQAPKPSMYMRQQEEAQEKQESKQKGSLTPGPESKDSGF